MAVVFCDVVSSTEVRDRLGDTLADVWFADLIHRLGDVTLEANGTVVKSLGDGVMAVFTSAGAAIGAAVAMQQAAVMHGWAHPDEAARLRVGVSIGDVARTTDDGIDDYNGMPVVEAARLCSAAAPDEILAAEVVRVLVGSRNEHPMEPIGDYTLKGISSPVRVVRVGWEPPLDRPAGETMVIDFPGPLSVARRGPFAGRSGLVADLLDAWKREEWRGLLVAGEPGIGKTRLTSELTHAMHVTGATVLLGRCDEDLAVGFRPWAEALAPLIDALPVDVLEGLLPEHTQELATIVPALRRRITLASELELDAATRTALLSNGIAALLAAAAPVVVVLDDIHWIDQSSLVILRHVLTNASTGVSIVGTYRDTDVDRVHPLAAALADLRRVDGVRRVALTGLDDAGVTEFVEAAAGHELDEAGRDLAESVHAQTSGNPLFVGEMLRHLAESGAIMQSGSRWVAGVGASAPLPEGLREVIGRRLTRLGDDATQALRVAAVLGRGFDVDVVDAVVGRDTLDDIERAIAAGIVIEGSSGSEFRHAVIRDVLLGELSSARRRRLHRDVVAVLEQRWALSVDRHLDELAYHHGEAQTAAAAAWHLRAAQAASDAFDARAAALVERGLELLDLATDDDPSLRCDLLIVRAASASRVNLEDSLGPAMVAFDTARLLGDEARMARAAAQAGLSSTADAGTERLAFLRAALAQITDTSLVERGLVAALIAANDAIGSTITPDEFAAANAEILRHLEPGSPGVERIAVDCFGNCVIMQRPRAAREIADRFGLSDDSIGWSGTPIRTAFGQLALTLGDRDGFDDRIATTFGHTQLRRASWLHEATLHQLIAMRELLDGDWVAAEAAVAVVERVGGHNLNFVLGCLSQRQWIMSELGDVEARYQEAVASAAAFPDFPVMRAGLVMTAAEAGRVAEVERLLDELAPDDFAAVGRGWLTTLSLGGVAWAVITVDAQRHASVLRRLLGEYSGLMARIASGIYVMCAYDRLLAGLAAVDGDHDEADRLFSAAIAQEEALRSPPLVTRTKHWWGRALLRRGEAERARPLLADARASAAQLGMRGVVAQIDDLLGAE